MDTMQALDRDRVRQLREARAWSQQHLADAAGLSLRTVQRVEAEGSASAETRLALAAALDVAVESLVPAGAPAVPSMSGAAVPEDHQDTIWVTAACALVVLVELALATRLPPEVASHFDVTGRPDATMSRNAFVLAMVLMSTLVPTLMWAGLQWSVRRGKLKLPNLDHWFAPSRRAATVRDLRRRFALLCCVVAVELGVAFGATCVVNLPGGSPSMAPAGILSGMALLLVFMLGWLTALNRRYAHLGD